MMSRSPSDTGAPTAPSDRGSGLPIRALHVGKIVPPPYAGIESHVDTLLRTLSPRIDGATLVASAPIGSPASWQPPPAPYRIIACRSFTRLASVAISPGLLASIRQEFLSGRANLLHLHAPNPWGDLAALRSQADTPVVMTWHSDIVGRPALFKLYSAVQQRSLRRADRIVVFTPKHLQGSVQLPRDVIERKVVQIPIGIDFARLHSTQADPAAIESIKTWSSGRPLILSVGRLVHYKGYEHLLDAVARLRTDAVLLLIGTGPLGSQLRRRVAEHGLDHRVRFLGEVDGSVLVAALGLCDIFCLPSIEQSEAFGIASAEAMSFGKPTVVCELNNGVNYLNQAGVTSLVTPPRDAAALAGALDTLVLDAPLRHRMGQAALQWVHSEFNVDAMLSGTLALYRELLGT